MVSGEVKNATKKELPDRPDRPADVGSSLDFNIYIGFFSPPMHRDTIVDDSGVAGVAWYFSMQ